ncbi:hypothetical protein BDA99DRAFT_540210 [Phascolomyces articulosus]|uniref:Uncharacterized protein n=1 Tax=Phascolomyces articulosus TaxID=60185 RepID=A0AAD5JTZ2_9FUNG|nr:hypothetical protein BDA99DRAFT_540210 [Phascolomyces articulosus]
MVQRIDDSYEKLTFMENLTDLILKKSDILHQHNCHLQGKNGNIYFSITMLDRGCCCEFINFNFLLQTMYFNVFIIHISNRVSRFFDEGVYMDKYVADIDTIPKLAGLRLPHSKK